MRKRISTLTAESLPWWIRLFGTLIGASAAADRHEGDGFFGIPTNELPGARSLTEVAYVALLGEAPQPANLFAFQTLVGQLLTNGPAAISAQYPRLLGCAAEIDDHMNRGRNMDTRTVASSCRFVA